jgi:hypothetical protein
MLYSFKNKQVFIIGYIVFKCLFNFAEDDFLFSSQGPHIVRVLQFPIPDLRICICFSLLD